MSWITDLDKLYEGLEHDGQPCDQVHPDKSHEEWEGEQQIGEMNVTGNMDGGAGPVKSPGAFSKSKKEDERGNAKNSGLKKAKKSKKHFQEETLYKKFSDILFLNELSYNDYKKDDTRTPKKKVNTAISEINKKLWEIEKIFKHNVKLKTELGVDRDQYWKSSRNKLRKISERILKMSKQFRDLSS